MAPNHALQIGISVEEGQLSCLKQSLFMDTRLYMTNVSAVFISQHKTQIPISLVKETFQDHLTTTKQRSQKAW